MAVTAQMVKSLREKTGAGMLDCKKALVETDGNIDKAIDWLREKGISKAAKKADRIAAEGLCSAVEDKNNAIVFELNSETDFVAKNDKFLKLLSDVGNALIKELPNNAEEALKISLDGKTLETVLTEATAIIGEKITLRRVVKLTKKDNEVFGIYSHNGGRIVAVTVLEGDKADAAKDISMHAAAMNPKFLNQDQISSEEVEKEKEALKKEALAEGKPAEIVDKMVMGRLNKYLKEICLVNQPFVKDPDLTVEKYAKNNGGKVLDFLRLEVGEGIEKKEVDFAEEVMSQVNSK